MVGKSVTIPFKCFAGWQFLIWVILHSKLHSNYPEVAGVEYPRNGQICRKLGERSKIVRRKNQKKD
jgi:hypothetical protein